MTEDWVGVGMKRVAVLGASGFIGHHLCRYLKEKGYWVRAVDIQYPRHFTDGIADEEWFGRQHDLCDPKSAWWALSGIDEVYQLAATMGGAGFVFSGDYDYEIMRDNSLININVLVAAKLRGVKRILYTSSACVYPEFKQDTLDAKPLKEDDAYPAHPDSEYGWEKLYAERLYATFSKDTGIPVRIARFHNIYGPEGSWNDGREKVPAAACRKVAEAKLTGSKKVQVWGDGEQVRSFCYIDDCLEMLYLLMHSNYDHPLNIGTDTDISINGLFELTAHIAGFSPGEIELVHVPGPQGVRKRNADLRRMQAVLGYQPRVPLVSGMEKTYDWIEEQVKRGAG